MPLNSKVMTAIEQLNYRVTVGDVAVQSGLDLQVAQQALMALASEAGGHLQVTETGEVAYLFSPNFRTILQAKFFKLRLLNLWQRIWGVLFYLIRISFGILLIASICIIAIAILLIVLATVFKDSDNSDNGGSSNSGGFSGFPIAWMFSDWFYFFSPSPYGTPRTPASFSSKASQHSSMNFLEAVFSFLFGEGNPNQNLEERRWQLVGQTLRYNQGAVIPEQVAPFLDGVDAGQTIDDAMLPVLLRFNGQPEVSPEGEIVYYFPELQTSVGSSQTAPRVPFLQEAAWRFSSASSGQVMAAMGLGGVNLVGALALGRLLSDSAGLGGFLGFVQAIYPVLLVYGLGFLAIPLGRHFWNQWQNQRIGDRNQRRERLAQQFAQSKAQLQAKLGFARQFAKATRVDDLDLVYTTETDLLDQEAKNQAAIDAEWQRRIDRSGH
ncbi:MAG: hypothetical protein MH252_09330 [Thermosynechococcaceae cyanobacterium MS004]|nr:hypothetical protein [Thermosynechococcaceae cyanobacterium MS004]